MRLPLLRPPLQPLTFASNLPQPLRDSRRRSLPPALPPHTHLRARAGQSVVRRESSIIVVSGSSIRGESPCSLSLPLPLSYLSSTANERKRLSHLLSTASLSLSLSLGLLVLSPSWCVSPSPLSLSLSFLSLSLSLCHTHTHTLARSLLSATANERKRPTHLLSLLSLSKQ